MTGGRNLTSLMLILASWIVMRVGLAGRSAADEPVESARKVDRPAEPVAMPILVATQLKHPSAELLPHAAKARISAAVSPLRVAQIAPPSLPGLSQIAADNRTTSLPVPPSAPTRINPAALASTAEVVEHQLEPIVPLSRRQPLVMTGSYWSTFRASSGAPALASRGELGGSQAGFRLSAPLPVSLAEGQIAVSLRGYSPLAHKRGKETAVGVSWSRPAALPVDLIIERRIGLDREGRDAVAAMVAGGFGPTILGTGWIAHGYAQAGIVGLRKRDGFADGQISLGREIVLPVLGKAQVGGGIWAGAQPRVHRVDAGPQLRIPLNIGPTSSQISTEWRFLLTGNARPSSGPTLTVSGSF